MSLIVAGVLAGCTASKPPQNVGFGTAHSLQELDGTYRNLGEFNPKKTPETDRLLLSSRWENSLKGGSRTSSGSADRADDAQSPITVTTTRRCLARLSKSTRTICCQVPSTILPAATGTVSDGPIALARTCAWPLPSCHVSS